MRFTQFIPVVLLGVALLPATAAAPSAPGQQIFRQRCQSCHAIEADKIGTLGPNLRGVVGRKAGTTSFRYSPALKASGLTWDRATLDRYLASPARVVPGTRMVMSVANPEQRAQLIDYLASQR